MCGAMVKDSVTGNMYFYWRNQNNWKVFRKVFREKYIFLTFFFVFPNKLWRFSKQFRTLFKNRKIYFLQSGSFFFSKKVGNIKVSNLKVVIRKISILKTKIVFCFQNCSDLLWEKKCSCDREKRLKFKAEG